MDGLGSKEPIQALQVQELQDPRHLARGRAMGEAGALTVGTPPHEFIANFRL